MKPPLWQLAIVVIAGLVIGWKLEDCRHVPDPQPAIAPGGLP